MANLWDQAGIPHTGWSLGEVIDRETADNQCEMCSKESIRYLHTMHHPNHADLFVGCVCAEKMSGDSITPKRQKQQLLNFNQRLERMQWEPVQESGILRYRTTTAFFDNKIIDIIYFARKGFRVQIDSHLLENMHASETTAKLFAIRWLRANLNTQ